MYLIVRRLTTLLWCIVVVSVGFMGGLCLRSFIDNW